VEWFKELAWNTYEDTFFFLNFSSLDAVDMWIENNLGDLRYMKRVLGVGYADKDMSYSAFMRGIDRLSTYCSNIEMVAVPSISDALAEEKCFFSSGKRYILCVKDSPVETDELIKDFGNEMLEKEIGMCINFRELRDETGRVSKVNDYGMSILPYVNMVEFSEIRGIKGIPRWFMTDMLKRGESVKWILASGSWAQQKQADKYPMLSELMMGVYSDFGYAKEKLGVEG